MLRKIASIKIPRSIRLLYGELASASQFESILKNRDVAQLDDGRIKLHGERAVLTWCRFWQELIALIPSFDIAPENKEPSILWFRSVTRHVDDWPNVCVGGRLYRPAFLHLVLWGSARIHVGKECQIFRRGDLFALDMNKPHWVDSRSLCATACLTYPKAALVKFAQLAQNSIEAA